MGDYWRDVKAEKKRHTKTVERADQAKNALQYVENTGGGATKAIFVEDHEPIGEILWKEIAEYVKEEDGRIYLNEAGKKKLAT